MPIDRHHAFSDGPSFAFRESGMLQKFLVWIFGKIVNKFIKNLHGIKIWEQFMKLTAIDTTCRLGPNAWCINNSSKKNIIIGKNSIIRGIIRREFYGEGRITIGDDVYIGDDTIISCCNAVKIGSRTLIAHGVQIYDNNTHPVDYQERYRDWKYILGEEAHKPFIAHAPVEIGDDCWIGLNSIILKGVTIGQGSIVSAGSVVSENVEPFCLVAGNPSKKIKRSK